MSDISDFRQRASAWGLVEGRNYQIHYGTIVYLYGSDRCRFLFQVTEEDLCAASLLTSVIG